MEKKKPLKNSVTVAIEKIRKEVLKLPGELADIRRANKNFPVIGEGSLSAAIMFVGEAPGKKESETGRPFCGASGKFLDELLAHVGLDRENVYITNIVNDRPPENRDPTPAELERYVRFLDRQIDILKPKVIATLGRISMAHIMRQYGLEADLASISKLHGGVFEAKAPYGKVYVVPLYHPAVALYNGSNRPVLLKDIEVLKDLIK